MRIREVAGRAALVLLGVAATVLVLEALLRSGAWVLEATGREPDSAWLPGSRSILCLGDSNTYGLWVDPGEAYPARLEALWNERAGEPPVEIVNLGYPGTNSSRVARELPGLLEVFAPDRVTLMVGVNDFWTAAVPTDAPGDEASLWQRSRLHRLLALLRARFRAPEEIDAALVETEAGGELRVVRVGGREFEFGYERGDGEAGDLAALAANITSVVDGVRDFGGELVLLTYPSQRDWYEIANRVTREVATATGAPLIDLAKVFEPRCPGGECPDLIFPNQHPARGGHVLIAETLAAELPRR